MSQIWHRTCFYRNVLRGLTEIQICRASWSLPLLWPAILFSRAESDERVNEFLLVICSCPSRDRKLCSLKQHTFGISQSLWGRSRAGPAGFSASGSLPSETKAWAGAVVSSEIEAWGGKSLGLPGPSGCETLGHRLPHGQQEERAVGQQRGASQQQGTRRPSAWLCPRGRAE